MRTKIDRLNTENKILFLKKKASSIREKYLEYVCNIGRSHVGGALSMCDVVVALFYQFMNWDISDIKNEDRDRFILSKGHCSELLYIIYADMGWCDKERLVEERLKIDGMLSGHASKRYLPMIEAGTGALGHGLSIAAGYAHACKVDRKRYKVICCLGDGELNEGSNWEAIMYASQNRLSNLIAIIDRNQYSSCKAVEKVIKMEDLCLKFEAFGWVSRRIQGNKMEEIYQCFDEIYNFYTGDKPIVVIADTKKGYGLEEAMYNPEEWHHREVSREMVNRYKEYGDG